MKSTTIIITGLLITSMLFCCKPKSNQISFNPYPETPEIKHTDTYFGEEIEDPFRWMEDYNDTTVIAWAKKQNDLTHNYLQQLPGRAIIEDLVSRYYAIPSVNLPIEVGDRSFWFETPEGSEHAVLYTKLAEGAPQSLIDPMAYDPEGNVSLGDFSIDPSEAYIAYELRESGSDWVSLRIKEISSGRELSDRVNWVKFSNITWTYDGKGFFYARYDAPQGDIMTQKNLVHQLYYHRVGDSQEQDQLIMRSDDHPEATIKTYISNEGRYLIIQESYLSRRQTYYLDLRNDNPPKVSSAIVTLINGFDSYYRFLGNRETSFYFQTDDHAPNRKVIKIDLSRPEKENWETIIPESTHFMARAKMFGERIVLEYIENLQSVLKIFDAEGNFSDQVKLPGKGTVTFDHWSAPGHFKEDSNGTGLYYLFQRTYNPKALYRYDYTRKESDLVDASSPMNESFTSEVIYFESKDGAKVPLTLTYEKNKELNGKTPVLFIVYGGFGQPMLPLFYPAIRTWLELGGMMGIIHARGGGEFGREWHKAGMMENKQNTFDDVFGAAEYLIKNGYTTPGRIALHGRSNGGLTVNACLSQRPELFGVALSNTGMSDMLRYHTYVGSQFGLTEFGTSENKAHYMTLKEWSPIHRVQPGKCYPPTLLFTAFGEDRVPPVHSYKMAATLQKHTSCDHPIMLRIEENAGHFGASNSLTKQINEHTDLLSFAAYHLNWDISNTDLNQ